MDKAKLFTNGRSQAVRLPVAYRFDGTEVYIRRDEKTGEVILSKQPSDWSEFISLRDENDSDIRYFMADRHDPPPPDRDLF